LFGNAQEALYEIVHMQKTSARLRCIKTLQQTLPTRMTYLAWSLLKKDKNDWVIQKATELGVTHLIPVQAERCARSDISNMRMERWQKIALEASEQCGRSDVPTISQPAELDSTLTALADKNVVMYIAQQDGDTQLQLHVDESLAVLIGPEGGWSDAEKQLFSARDVRTLHLSQFTLRAETAAIIASSRLA
jgi:16S rRNA (uracil1498-N3)-methyltransferase